MKLFTDIRHFFTEFKNLFFKPYLCFKRNISSWVLITYHPYICKRIEKTITLYIINTLLLVEYQYIHEGTSKIYVQGYLTLN